MSKHRENKNTPTTTRQRVVWMTASETLFFEPLRSARQLSRSLRRERMLKTQRRDSTTSLLSSLAQQKKTWQDWIVTSEQLSEFTQSTDAKCFKNIEFLWQKRVKKKARGRKKKVEKQRENKKRKQRGKTKRENKKGKQKGKTRRKNKKTKRENKKGKQRKEDGKGEKAEKRIKKVK